ncbi:MAG: HAMP domain-containing sensor histidine kinase [Candidatus Aminicenantales bacterium]
MKNIAREIWARRKFSSLFLVGILIPSLIVSYLSWSAFSTRREAFRKAIESQLWISGETAVKSIESALQNYEDRVLAPGNFAPFTSQGEHFEKLGIPTALAGEKVFLLDADFRILFPEVGDEEIPYDRWQWLRYDPQFATLYQRAEYLEFTQKDQQQAARLYQRCLGSTPHRNLQALAFEGYGRCLFASSRFEEAFQAYGELLNQYEQFRNQVGHPYGLLAALRLYDIAEHLEKRESLQKTLIQVLERLKNGEWRLKSSAYDFYAQELESILAKELSENKNPALEKALQSVLAKPSPYLEELEFKSVLGEQVIPVLKERIAFSQFSNEPPRGRLPVALDGSTLLISYSRLDDRQSDSTFTCGFIWDLEFLKNQKLPEIAESLAKASGIQVRVIEEGAPDGTTKMSDLIPKDALSLSFRQFPFPWRLVVTQSALDNLKNAALRNNIFHGILLAIVVALMCLGAFMIARDVARESEITRQKSEFVHNISHELKTPLTLIRLFGETLKDKKNLGEKDKQQAYDIITRESERLSYMINNVLDFSRIEMGRREFNFKTGDLAQTLAETVDSYRIHLEEKGFSIHEGIDLDLPQIVFDREAVASVLINLLSNAMKFSPDQKEVTIRLFRSGDEIVLQVVDKGIGIARNELNKIFKRFYRSENQFVSESRGSGLGLTIIQHIAQAHGGRVEVESELGRGSAFSFYLPLSKKTVRKT